MAATTLGWLMAEDVRPVREHEVDEVIAVGVDDVGSLAANDVGRNPGHGAIGAHRAVDPAGKHPLGSLAQRPGVAVLHCARSALAR